MLRKKLTVLVAAVMMLAMTLAMAGTALAKDGCGPSCGGGGETLKAEGKNNGWGDGNGGGKGHKNNGCSICG